MKSLCYILVLLSAACGGGSASQDAAVDPCLACSAHSTCDATAAAACSCVTGYAGDGTLAGTGCADVDECAAGTSTCDSAHGTCTNTDGSFTCACATGYAGDGTTCADADECVAGTSTCDVAHGACTNTPGSFTCACNAGFTGDGNTAGTGCTDVDECATPDANTCDNFTCSNSPGGFVCTGLLAIEPFAGVLARLDPTTFQLLDLIPVTSTGAVSGVTAMARDPLTGTNYATAKVAGVTGRAFGTINLATGVFTVIAPVDKFSSLEFLPDGTLYGVTGAGATAPKTVYTIDKATGVATLVGALGHGADGEVICYDSDAQLMLHWTGNNSSIMESFPLTVAPLVTTNVSPGLTGIGEVFGCRYLGNHTFLVHDINSHVRLVTSAGVVSTIPTAIAALFEDVRAALPTATAVPHNVRPKSGAAAGGDMVTIRGIGLTGATAVSFGTVAAASFIVVDDTTITAVTPAGTAGIVDVTVATPLPFDATWPASFTYLP